MNISDEMKKDGFLLLEKFEKEDHLFDTVLWMDSNYEPQLVFGIKSLTLPLLESYEKLLEIIFQQDNYSFDKDNVVFVSSDNHPVVQIINERISTEGIGPIALHGTTFNDIIVPNAFIYKI
ncbi:hypothetical protein ODZ84_22835 [Chryseobacterium fluminis]|uniref:hypothetical protein n=1 Tax=Chryseobacterium fluminis TaxID=2983606 RepID=UPI00224E637A|nr:hypothetical protein [Chryseobacterium sp. MMS21-Ot14]UZT97967.1 hypothetical protein ODZ84_22835 [Chryseobacterium sp. MMS21-Ot14]